MGTTLVELGQRDEACEAFRRALELDPTDSRTHYNSPTPWTSFAAEAGQHWRAYLWFDSTSPWAKHAR